MSGEHLGGHVPGGDPATFYPALWSWLVRERGVRTVLDVGCGPDAVAVKFFRSEGADAVGVDGVRGDRDLVLPLDFAQPTRLELRRLADLWHGTPPDLVWCCEFVEHVEETHLPQVLAVISRCELLLLTHAEPGQLGHHHVNCQPSPYWVGALAASGMRLDQGLTDVTRQLAAFNPHPLNHFVRSGMAFTQARPLPGEEWPPPGEE
jgi:hypothetical protein